MPEIKFSPKICGIVDERGEIAAMYKGVPQNDIGINSDVVNNVPKPIGINMLIRSMGPQIIICDEIGSKEDIEETVSDVFIVLWKNAEKVQVGKLKGYLCTIARTRTLNKIAANKNTKIQTYLTIHRTISRSKTKQKK